MSRKGIEGAQHDLCPFPFCSQALLLRLQESGKKRTTLYPLPKTHRVPGLGQKAAVLFLQALGQSLQVLQLLIHAPGKLQSLLGTGGGGEVGHRRERKTEVTEVDPLRATEKSQSPGEGGTETYREGQRPSEKRRKDTERATETQFLPQIPRKCEGTWACGQVGRGGCRRVDAGPGLPAELLAQG